jgi:hypothetical protein
MSVLSGRISSLLRKRCRTVVWGLDSRNWFGPEIPALNDLTFEELRLEPSAPMIQVLMQIYVEYSKIWLISDFLDERIMARDTWPQVPV